MGSMAMMHPWLLLGLIGAAVPIVIHLIGRHKAPTVKFAAFHFLMAVSKRLARRERLRQFLLLLIRTLAIIALVLAVARPMPEHAAAMTQGSQRLVLVIDASGSMAYADGISLLSRAKNRAKEVLSHLSPGDAATLIVAKSTLGIPFQAPTVDHTAVRRAIEGIDALPLGVADLGAAIDTGLNQMGTDGTGVTLVVITDLSRNSFDALQPTGMTPPPRLRVIDIAKGIRKGDNAPLGNLAIENIRVTNTANSASERRFIVEMRNYGGEPIKGRALELTIDGRVTHRGFVDIAAGGTNTKIFTHQFTGPGAYHGQVRLMPRKDDGYGADDSAWFVANIISGISVLAVNGDPRTTPYEDELFFVERALQAVPKGHPPIAMNIVTTDELVESDFNGIDVVLIANAGTLPGHIVQAIDGFVKRGGGLFLALGDRIKFERVNAEWAEILPHALRDVHRIVNDAANAPPVGIVSTDWDHPILHHLGVAAQQSLHASRTREYFNLAVGAGLASRVILKFDNGAPAWVEGRRGKGRVLLATTSIDLDMSDLPLRSIFPPLLQRAMRYLAHAIDTEVDQAARLGHQVVIPAPTGVTAIALRGPMGKRIEVAAKSDRRALFRDLNTPGIYSAQIMRHGAWVDAPHLGFALNGTLDESNFAPLRPQKIAEALAEQQSSIAIPMVGTGTDSDPFKTRGLASYFLIAVFCAFVGESLLAVRG